MNDNDLTTTEGPCPACGADWQGDPIPEESREHYGEHAHFSRLIGIELAYNHPDHYDGVSYWQCPDCRAGWDRWTHKLVVGGEW